MEGGCRCGACRYTLALDALPPVYCCHCLDCQSWSGSAFVEQAVIRPDTIAMTGPVVEGDVLMPSGSVSHQVACGQCFSRLVSTNASRPGMALLRAGTLDDSDRIEPRAHIWTRRKQRWIGIAEGVPCFPENAPPAEMMAILTR